MKREMIERIQNVEKINKGTIIRQWLQILLGLSVFALGNHLTIFANIGVNPWDCLSLGIANRTPLSYGDAVAVSSVLIMIIALLMKEHIGFGTLGGAFLTGYIIQFFNSVNPLPKNENLWTGILWMTLGMVFISIGLWLYLSAGQYAGPRDALMVGIGKRVKRIPIGVVQIALWAVICLIGYLLGGPVGIGTLISTFGNGLIMQAVFHAVRFDPRTVQNRDCAEVIKTLLYNGKESNGVQP